jgi:tetratricopeptide (TPR) repeat protein
MVEPGSRQLPLHRPAEETPEPPGLVLPPAPPDQGSEVKAWSEPVVIRSYMPEPPDRNPMFLDRRVYQGSSGRVYPLPVIDRIATEAQPHAWQAVHLENEFLRIMILPEIGGRIHVGYDKSAGYDFFYRQNVIKPALVGLAGPWISGGVEFNWPQHHRPATFMPVETEIERHDDGSVTVWCSDHDPMQRMKGMHGVCLRPGYALLELKVRLYNRTPNQQTFLWWANVATRVHERYQSFFPADVRFVADHAKRAVTSYPQSWQPYYGIDYGAREQDGVPEEERPSHFVPDGSYPANDLGWYANIPVPTSYMIAGTEQDFFGGYDHAAQAGVVHVANHHISPGKKQWTWGNHDFGYAWDRNLTDSDGPYIELMAGVYTDNQPDFSYLAPWETKVFTQCWYPISRIGVPQAANTDAALHLSVEGRAAHVGLYATHDLGAVTIRLQAAGEELRCWAVAASVREPVVLVHQLPLKVASDNVSVSVESEQGVEIISYDPAAIVPATSPAVAVEPMAPEEIASLEELYLTGVHLRQYRHATRSPERYWREALRRDPGDSRCNTAMALWHLHRGELDLAEASCQAAVARVTKLNPNPADGEPYYTLGLVRRAQGKLKVAYDVFYKATWNAAWRGPAYHALAELDMSVKRWELALEHLERSLHAEADNLLARAWQVVALRRLERPAEAEAKLAEIHRIDPLDLTSRWLAGAAPANGQERLDLVFDLLRIGLRGEARSLLAEADLNLKDGTAPIVLLLSATLAEDDGKTSLAEQYWIAAAAQSLYYCFPNRLEESLLLRSILERRPEMAAPWALIGNFLYDRRRCEEAIAAWERSLALGLESATVHRNLGIAYFNVRRDATAAQKAFADAMKMDPEDARVLYEKDQLAKRTGEAPEPRLAELSSYPSLVSQRDDLSLEKATLLNETDQPEVALDVLLGRRFQPWEGGEGLVLAQYVRAHLLLGQRALDAGEAAAARAHFEAALDPPQTLSEARHLLANQSDIFYWLGVAEGAAGNAPAAKAWWERAVRQKGDFQQMSVRAVSEMTYWTALSLFRLQRIEEGEALLRRVLDYAGELERADPKIDYFATSLPAMLLFEDDLRLRADVTAAFLRAQAMAGLGRVDEAKASLERVRDLDRNHPGATDLRRQLVRMRIGEAAR